MSEPPEPGGVSSLSESDRGWLLRLARASVTMAVRTRRLPELDPATIPSTARPPRAAFVTLTRQGQLRGCIGNLIANRPLYAAVMENSRNAATRDPRFPAVEPAELAGLRIEISVLSEPAPLLCESPVDLLDRLRPGRDGVVLQVGPRTATFLPQVWEQLPAPADFLDALARKAGAAPDAWRDPETRVSTYHVEAFEEPEPGAARA